MPLFLDAIGHVVGLGSEEEMIWTNAGGIVAAMQNEQVIRDVAIDDLPCDPMGSNTSIHVAHVKCPVSELVFRAYPIPARGRFSHSRPESTGKTLDSFCAPPSIQARGAAKPCQSASHRPDKKGLPADFTQSTESVDLACPSHVAGTRTEPRWITRGSPILFEDGSAGIAGNGCFHDSIIEQFVGYILTCTKADGTGAGMSGYGNGCRRVDGTRL